jgi:hypothetical protein
MKYRLGIAGVISALLLTSMPANAQLIGPPDRPPPGPSPRPGPPPGPPEPRRTEARRILAEDIAACSILVDRILSELQEGVDAAADADVDGEFGTSGALDVPGFGVRGNGQVARAAVALCVLRADEVRRADPPPIPAPDGRWGW